MKNVKTYLLAAVIAVVSISSCNSGNNSSTQDNQGSDTSSVSDTPQAQQPNGYAPSNAKGEADSMNTNDSVQ